MFCSPIPFLSKHSSIFCNCHYYQFSAHFLWCWATHPSCWNKGVVNNYQFDPFSRSFGETAAYTNWWSLVQQFFFLKPLRNTWINWIALSQQSFLRLNLNWQILLLTVQTDQHLPPLHVRSQTLDYFFLISFIFLTCFTFRQEKQIAEAEWCRWSSW